MSGQKVLAFPRDVERSRLRRQRDLVIDLDVAVDAARLEASGGGGMDDELFRQAVHRRDVAAAELQRMISAFPAGQEPDSADQGGVS